MVRSKCGLLHRSDTTFLTCGKGDGASNEIYSLTLHPIFIGLKFCELSYYLFCEFQIILFAVRVDVSGLVSSFEADEEDRHTVLNPGPEYVLKADDECIFLAQDRGCVALVSELVSTC